MKIKKSPPRALKILAAVLAAFCAVNLLCGAVFTLPPKYTVSGKATPEIWQKNALVIHGLEGYAINFTDDNGYNNPPGILNGSYALALGSSHTQGFNVSQNQNYCSLYNDFAAKNGLPLLYNAGMDANHFADILKHFSAAVQEFPDAEFILIETPYFTFTQDQLTDALQMVDYEEHTDNTGILTHLYGFVQSMPLLRLLVRQVLESDTSEWKNAFFQADANAAIEPQSIDYSTYQTLLTECFQKLRTTTDKPIYLLYHRTPLITDTGCEIQSESIDGNPILPLIRSLCDTYNITLLLPDERYIENYTQHQTLPYGFHNTTYGEGHLNQTGHKLLAQMIEDAVKEDMK